MQRKVHEAPTARKRSSLQYPAGRLAGEALGTPSCPESRGLRGTHGPEEITASHLVDIETVGNIVSAEGESANVKITLPSENPAVACFKTGGCCRCWRSTKYVFLYTIQEFESCMCVYHFIAILCFPLLLGKDSVEGNSTRG